MLDSQSKIQKIIENSLREQESQRRDFSLFGKWFYVKEHFLTPINISRTLEELEEKIPAHLFEEIDEFFVGDFDFLTDKGLEAQYKDGAVYISNSIGSEIDLVENVIHEVSHSLETRYGHVIYGDQKLAREFLLKRNSLRSKLKQEGYDISEYDFENLEYDEDFDFFLYEAVGYAQLNNLVVGIMPSAYAATSLREYWSVGFEDYFVGDREYLKRVSPILFSKVEEVITDEY